MSRPDTPRVSGEQNVVAGQPQIEGGGPKFSPQSFQPQPTKSGETRAAFHVVDQRPVIDQGQKTQINTGERFYG